jgi:two-component sensor histidine kinase
MAREEDEFLPGGGAMGEVVRRFNWSATALGPVTQWPATLKVSVGIVLSSHFPQALIWGNDFVTVYNDAFAPILAKKHPCIGQSFAKIWSEAWHEIGPIAARALQGESTFIQNYALLIHRRDVPETAYFTFCYSPVRDETGRICGFLDTVVETTDAVIAARTTRLLNSELAHRLQNTLSVVNGISQETLRSATSLGAAQMALSERISALGRTHSLLSTQSFEEASLRTLIKSSLAHVPSENHPISVTGSDLMVGARQAMVLALALNELVTNAIKYGALSKPGGSISISWEAESGEFKLIWREQNGPAVSRPSRRGFGLRLIEDILPRDLQGQVSLDYLPEGLTLMLMCEVRALSGK